jgi:hypothetical protein
LALPQEVLRRFFQKELAGGIEEEERWVQFHE